MKRPRKGRSETRQRTALDMKVLVWSTVHRCQAGRLIPFPYTWTRAGVSAHKYCRYNTASCSPERGRRNANSNEGRVRGNTACTSYECTRSKDDGAAMPRAPLFLLPAASCSLATEGRHKNERRRINGRAVKCLFLAETIRLHVNRAEGVYLTALCRGSCSHQAVATQDSPLSSRALRQEMPATLFAGGTANGVSGLDRTPTTKKGAHSERREDRCRSVRQLWHRHWPVPKS